MLNTTRKNNQPKSAAVLMPGQLASASPIPACFTLLTAAFGLIPLSRKRREKKVRLIPNSQFPPHGIPSPCVTQHPRTGNGDSSNSSLLARQPAALLWCLLSWIQHLQMCTYTAEDKHGRIW